MLSPKTEEQSTCEGVAGDGAQPEEGEEEEEKEKGPSPGRGKGKGKAKGKEKDSPAFRLRPRRSTPRSSPGASSSRRYSFFSPKNAAFGPQGKGFKLKYNSASSVKRRLFKLLSNQEEEKNVRVVVPLTPSKSIIDDFDLGIFVQKIAAEELQEVREYQANYVSLKIVFIFDILKTEDGEEALKLLAQEAGEGEDLVDETKPLVVVTLFGLYARCSSLDVGKIIEVAKFKTEALDASRRDSSFRINECDINALPYNLIVKATDDPFWVPLMSVKTKYDSPQLPDVLTSAPPRHPPLPSFSSSITSRREQPEIVTVVADVESVPESSLPERRHSVALSLPSPPPPPPVLGMELEKRKLSSSTNRHQKEVSVPVSVSPEKRAKKSRSSSNTSSGSSSRSQSDLLEPPKSHNQKPFVNIRDIHRRVCSSSHI